MQVSEPEAVVFVPSRDGLSLESKDRIAKIVVEDGMGQFERPVVLWTAGKDSTLTLWYVRSVCKEMGVPCPPILFIDHGTHFDETWRLFDEVVKDWGLESIIARNDDILGFRPAPGAPIRVKDLSQENQSEVMRTGFRERTFPYALGNLVANHLLKTVPMNAAFRKHGFDCAFTGIRWDEDDARSRERFVSPRADPPHVRVHPILHFTEREVWTETLRLGLPRHPLYDRGYRSFDGKYDSRRVGDTPAWEQDFDSIPERMGRAQDKEQIMHRLRELGYM
ncbi:MAG: phosphoadenosine phosphosulfate reductase family protein [Methanobacteriota archaeon]|nr:MAG: phosphoadenosine phosphosulfate reductase family protein [Euryarchaeota archaeon]